MFNCCICGDPASEMHHEPPKSLLSKKDYNPKKGIDNPIYKHLMCRKHHQEREDRLCYREFKEKYPHYKGISIMQYRNE